MSIVGPAVHGPAVPAHKPYIITVWAEESGYLRDGKFEWSFGNGAAGKNSGYTMMRPGNINMMSLTAPQASTAVGSAAVNISVDEVEINNYGVSIPKGKQSVFVHFEIPYYVGAGSVINVVSESNSKDTSASVVALLIELII